MKKIDIQISDFSIEQNKIKKTKKLIIYKEEKLELNKPNFKSIETKKSITIHYRMPFIMEPTSPFFLTKMTILLKPVSLIFFSFIIMKFIHLF
jgi:hypothetical protein